MAKKNTTTSTIRTRRRKTTEPAAAPVDVATVAGTESVESAADRATSDIRRAEEYRPTPEEIAEAAYQRYVSRGGQDGADFDDWVEAERELRSRHSR